MLLTAKTPAAGYYRQLFAKARQYCVDLPAKQWCDFWHEHFDWCGYGNHSHADRRRHLRALFMAFERATRELAAQPMPHQLFLNISRRDAGCDALYVHTANPNGTPFPHDFAGSRTTRHTPGLLRGLYDPHRHHLRIQRTLEDTWYIVLPREQADLLDRNLSQK